MTKGTEGEEWNDAGLKLLMETSVPGFTEEMWNKMEEALQKLSTQGIETEARTRVDSAMM